MRECCPPPEGTVDLFLHTAVKNTIIFVGDFYPEHLSAPWQQMSLCWPQWESSPLNLGSISVFVPPRSSTPNLHLFLCQRRVWPESEAGRQRESAWQLLWTGVSVLILKQPARMSHWLHWEQRATCGGLQRWRARASTMMSHHVRFESHTWAAMHSTLKPMWTVEVVECSSSKYSGRAFVV